MDGQGPSLIFQLDCILRWDPLIDELGLVPSVSADALPLERAPQSAGSSPPHDSSAFWVGDHKLAIALEAARAMYSAALPLLKKARTADPACNSDSELLQATQATVIVNPEHYTAWNMRKRAVLRASRPSDAASVELQLTTLALSVHPKSEATWSHRRWVLRSLLRVASCPQPDVLERESALAQRCAKLRPMNYRAWSHRAWAAQFMPAPQLHAELQASATWAAQHVSDNCGLHYRRRLILLLLQYSSRTEGAVASAQYVASLADLERAWLTPLLEYYQGREALWLHRRFLAQLSCTFEGTSSPTAATPSAVERPEKGSEDSAALPGEPRNEKGGGEHAIPFPVWSCEQQLLDEVGTKSLEGSAGEGSLRSPWTSEEAFVAELVRNLRSSARDEQAGSRAQLLLAGKHKLWARTILYPSRIWHLGLPSSNLSPRASWMLRGFSLVSKPFSCDALGGSA